MLKAVAAENDSLVHPSRFSFNFTASELGNLILQLRVHRQDQLAWSPISFSPVIIKVEAPLSTLRCKSPSYHNLSFSSTQSLRCEPHHARAQVTTCEGANRARDYESGQCKCLPDFLVCPWSALPCKQRLCHRLHVLISRWPVHSARFLLCLTKCNGGFRSRKNLENAS